MKSVPKLIKRFVGILMLIRVVRPARKAGISGKELRENKLRRAALRGKRRSKPQKV